MNVSVIIPALNEAATVGDVVSCVLDDKPDEVLVIDADSTDATVDEATRAGATVINWRNVLPTEPVRPGKGESLWRGVCTARGDLVVFVDADLVDPQPGLIRSLVEPFDNPDIHLVRPRYERTLEGAPSGGGRVTELTAKPLLTQLFPELSDIHQPLGGEYALRRSTALNMPFVGGFGVEAGLLVDVWRAWGRASISQVDLPPRRHRNKPLEDLVPTAEDVAATLLNRAGVPAPGFPGERPPLSTML